MERLQYKVEIQSSADTAAIERAKRVQEQFAQTVQQSQRVQERMNAGQSAAAGAAKGNSMAVLELSRAYEDAQYGIRGVLNNIPTLVMALGGGAGLAGVVSLTAVLLSQLGGAFKTTEEKQKELTDATEKQAEAQEKANREAQEKIREEFRETRREIDEYLNKMEEANTDLSDQERAIKREERAGLAEVGTNRQLAEAGVAGQKASGAINDFEAQRQLAQIRAQAAEQEEKIRIETARKLEEIEGARWERAGETIKQLQKALDEATKKLADAEALSSFQTRLNDLDRRRSIAETPAMTETPAERQARENRLARIREEEAAMRSEFARMQDSGVDLVTRTPEQMKTLEEEIRKLTETLQEQLRKAEEREKLAGEAIDDQKAAIGATQSTTEITRRQSAAEIAAANRLEAEQRAEQQRRAKEDAEREQERADREARAAREGSQRAAQGTARDALSVARGGNLAPINLDQLAAATAAVEDGATVAELEQVGQLLNAFSTAIINNSQAQRVRLEIIKSELEARIANLRNGN